MKNELHDLGSKTIRHFFHLNLFYLCKVYIKVMTVTKIMNENKQNSELGLQIPVSPNVKPRLKNNKVY